MKEDWDIYERSINYQSIENTKMNRHNIVMSLGLVGAFLVGLVSAYKGGLNLANIIDMLVSGGLAAEHWLAGNTTS